MGLLKLWGLKILQEEIEKTKSHANKIYQRHVSLLEDTVSREREFVTKTKNKSSESVKDAKRNIKFCSKELQRIRDISDYYLIAKEDCKFNKKLSIMVLQDWYEWLVKERVVVEIYELYYEPDFSDGDELRSSKLEQKVIEKRMKKLEYKES